MWDIKYRPNKYADVLGQEGNVKLLKARLARGTAYDTSYLFQGGHGKGKTTLARIHARAMLCQRLNKEDPEPCNECDNCLAVLRDQCDAFSERDAASQGKIDHIRALVEKLGFAVGNARMRIELFDEAHRIGDGAQDVLLKPLEEKKLVGMFCTTEPNKIKGTIRTRCEEYVLRPVTREDILKRAKSICEAEGVASEDDALLTIIDNSGGHIRDIINKMEMISQVGAINVANTRDYLHLGAINIYYEILLNLPNPAKAIELIDQACENVAPEEVVEGIAEAAMNSFRLANNMYTDFVLVNRDLGKQVYDLYKEGTIRLSDYFLRNKYSSRVTLMRDVLLLTQLEGNLPPKGPPQPLQIILGGGVPDARALVSHTASSVAPPPPQAPQAPVSLPTTEAVASPPALNGHAKNGHAVPKDPPPHGYMTQVEWAPPRTRVDTSSPIPSIGATTPAHELDARLLKPDEWQRLFIVRRQGFGQGSDG